MHINGFDLACSSWCANLSPSVPLFLHKVGGIYGCVHPLSDWFNTDHIWSLTYLPTLQTKRLLRRKSDDFIVIWSLQFSTYIDNNYTHRNSVATLRWQNIYIYLAYPTNLINVWLSQPSIYPLMLASLDSFMLGKIEDGMVKRLLDKQRLLWPLRSCFIKGYNKLPLGWN